MPVDLRGRMPDSAKAGVRDGAKELVSITESPSSLLKTGVGTRDPRFRSVGVPRYYRLEGIPFLSAA